MTKKTGNVWVTLFIAISVLMGCANKDQSHGHDVFTCPMHPTVVSDRPGACPVCGMDLVRKARPGEDLKITEDLARILGPRNEMATPSIRTIKGQYKSIPVAVHAQGLVTYDTRDIHTVSARVGGRLEKIYLKSEYQPVSKGQKIAEIYSPELVTAQREFIFVLENDPENKKLRDASARKLELLGMTAGQISDLLRTKKPAIAINVYSDHSGYFITQHQTPLLREGDYVVSGQTLFTVASASALRIELNLPATYAGAIAVGSKVQLNFGEGEKEATVHFIQPFFTEGQDFITLRVYTNRNEGLQLGRLVNARIRLANTASLWVPREAVLDLGNQKVVFVKERGVLKPRAVTAGITADGMTAITGGLASAEEIAANAQFLIDSESFIKPVE